jgi:hypothetical protein
MMLYALSGRDQLEERFTTVLFTTVLDVSKSAKTRLGHVVHIVFAGRGPRRAARPPGPNARSRDRENDPTHHRGVLL